MAISSDAKRRAHRHLVRHGRETALEMHKASIADALRYWVEHADRHPHGVQRILLPPGPRLFGLEYTALEIVEALGFAPERAPYVVRAAANILESAQLKHTYIWIPDWDSKRIEPCPAVDECKPFSESLRDWLTDTKRELELRVSYEVLGKSGACCVFNRRDQGLQRKPVKFGATIWEFDAEWVLPITRWAMGKTTREICVSSARRS